MHLLFFLCLSVVLTNLNLQLYILHNYEEIEKLIILSTNVWNRVRMRLRIGPFQFLKNSATHIHYYLLHEVPFPCHLIVYPTHNLVSHSRINKDRAVISNWTIITVSMVSLLYKGLANTNPGPFVESKQRLSVSSYYCQVTGSYDQLHHHPISLDPSYCQVTGSYMISCIILNQHVASRSKRLEDILTLR